MTGDIHLNSGDDLTEATLAKHSYRTSTTDYVDVGMGFSGYDGVNNTVDIASGFAIVGDDGGEQLAFPVSADSETDLSLPVTSGETRIWLVVDVGADTVNFEATDSSSTPTSPSLGGTLEIGTVNTSTDETTPLNRGQTYQISELSGGVTENNLITSLLGENMGVSSGELTANVDGANAAQLGGEPASYYAPLGSPTFTGTPTITGIASTMQVGEDGQGGPHGFKFGNNAGEDVGFLGFRTAEDAITLENFTTGTTIATFPIDGSTQPTIFGQEVRTLQDGNSQPNFTVGPNPPQNPEENDVWIDTS